VEEDIKLFCWVGLITNSRWMNEGLSYKFDFKVFEEIPFKARSEIEETIRLGESLRQS
jgi:hypothetical protein